MAAYGYDGFLRSHDTAGISSNWTIFTRPDDRLAKFRGGEKMNQEMSPLMRSARLLAISAEWRTAIAADCGKNSSDPWPDPRLGIKERR